MHIRIGHTPDADDAFMFYGIQLDRVERPDRARQIGFERALQAQHRAALEQGVDPTPSPDLR